MKKVIKTTFTAAFSIALRNFADSLMQNYPQVNPSIINDLTSIAESSTNCYSVEVICNPSVEDDEDFTYDDNF